MQNREKYKQYVERYYLIKKDYTSEILDSETFEPTEIFEHNIPSTYIPSILPTVHMSNPMSYNFSPTINNTNCPSTNTNITIPTYIPSYMPNKSTNNSISSYHLYYENSTIVFYIATSIGTFCLCFLCIYVYKLYTSKKHKLQKIYKKSLKHKYSSFSDIQNNDYNSNF